MARTKKVAETTAIKDVVVAEVKEKATKKVTKKEKVVTKPTTTNLEVKGQATVKSFAVIIRPLITEKSMSRIEKQNKITVEVDAKANRTEVKLAFEATYKVKVKQVNILNVRPKYTRRGRYPGTISGFKKAIVTLVSGQALDLFKE
jgi:large subunit ribosomal protein L23